ncbi:hypothetical protein XF14_10820 [Burkholderia gladioli]|nr:hypothetical protein XF14_10820 [Burkholderia gladioli]
MAAEIGCFLEYAGRHRADKCQVVSTKQAVSVVADQQRIGDAVEQDAELIRGGLSGMRTNG